MKQNTPITIAIEKLKVKRDLYRVELKKQRDIYDTYSVSILVLENLLEQEKQMVIDAWGDSISSNRVGGEQYYNEIFEQ